MTHFLILSSLRLNDVEFESAAIGAINSSAFDQSMLKNAALIDRREGGKEGGRDRREGELSIVASD